MKNLDDFLSGDDPGQAEAEKPSAADLESPATGDPPAAAEGGESPAKPPAKAADEADDAQPAPEDVVGLKSALQAERARRRDYKGERDRLAGEMAALKAEVEAARKANEARMAPAEQRAAPAPQVIPNSIEDPAGYHAYWETQRFSDKLDVSEDRLRDKIGDDADVDAKIAKFKAMVATNPALGAELRTKRNPYQFAYDTAKQSMALEEMGDPDSYRAKLEADIRAKIEAEYAAAGRPAPVARVNLPQSLGTARSAGPRSIPVTAAPEFEDIFRRSTKRA